MKEITLVVLTATCGWLGFLSICTFMIQADAAAFNRQNDQLRQAWEQRMAQLDAVAQQQVSVSEGE